MRLNTSQSRAKANAGDSWLPLHCKRGRTVVSVLSNTELKLLLLLLFNAIKFLLLYKKKNATYLVSLTLSFFFKFFSFPGASTLNGWVVLRKCSSPLLLLEALPLCLSASFCVSRLLAVRAATAWRQTGAFPETRARATLWLPQTHLGVFTYSFTNRARLLCKTGPATFKIWPPSRGNQLFSAPESSHNSLCI